MPGVPGRLRRPSAADLRSQPVHALPGEPVELLLRNALPLSRLSAGNHPCAYELRAEEHRRRLQAEQKEGESLLKAWGEKPTSTERK